MEKGKKRLKKFPCELRYDLAGKDWVIVATGRAKRPHTFKEEEKKEKDVVEKECPFCDLSDQEKPVLVFNKGKELPAGEIPKEWTTVSLPNKYPAFIPYPKLEKKKEGRFRRTMNAVGFHEVVVTRDHKKSIALLGAEKVRELIEVYYRRYVELKDKKFVNYISIFHNHGRRAGASVSHPHSQIITTPLIDVDLKEALSNAKEYYDNNGNCVYCDSNDWEKKKKKRIVFENEDFMAICPFASKVAFQTIISPKRHSPYFEDAKEKERDSLAEAFLEVFKKIYKGLGNPSYNFYLHTSPCDGGKYPYYHWHWTILPKTSIMAGFELGAGMEISTIEPEKAAAYLKKQ